MQLEIVPFYKVEYDDDAFKRKFAFGKQQEKNAGQRYEQELI